jgi:hypothetical protein
MHKSAERFVSAGFEKNNAAPFFNAIVSKKVSSALNKQKGIMHSLLFCHFLKENTYV